MTSAQPSPANNAAPEVSRVNDFDQSVKHDHRPGNVCPAGDWPTPKVYSMAPSILEFRIKELETDLENEKRMSARKGMAIAELEDQRSIHFEQITSDAVKIVDLTCDLKSAREEVKKEKEQFANLKKWAIKAEETLRLAAAILPEDAQDVSQIEHEIELRDKRIVELEGLVTRLAKHIDIMDADTIFITGNSLAEHA